MCVRVLVRDVPLLFRITRELKTYYVGPAINHGYFFRQASEDTPHKDEKKPLFDLIEPAAACFRRFVMQQSRLRSYPEITATLD